LELDEELLPLADLELDDPEALPLLDDDDDDLCPLYYPAPFDDEEDEDPELLPLLLLFLDDPPELELELHLLYPFPETLN